MKNELKNGLIQYVTNMLRLKSWKNINEPNLFMDSSINREMYKYIPPNMTIRDLKKSKNFSLLIEILESYEEAIDNDWLPDIILDLPIDKAYIFLKEIKNILESNIPDEQIDEELMKKYNEIKG